ncbi:unnamed protein product [Choristocarpus tenellus]
MQLQSFVIRLGRSKSVQKQQMPPWWRGEVHDVILLVATCVHGRNKVKDVIQDTALTALFKKPSMGSQNLLEGNESSQGVEGSKDDTPSTDACTAPTPSEDTRAKGAGDSKELNGSGVAVVEVAGEGGVTAAPVGGGEAKPTFSHSASTLPISKWGSIPFFVSLSTLGLGVTMAKSRMTLLHREILSPARITTSNSDRGCGVGGSMCSSDNSPRPPSAMEAGPSHSGAQSPSIASQGSGSGSGFRALESPREEAKWATAAGSSTEPEQLQGPPVPVGTSRSPIPGSMETVPRNEASPIKLKTSHSSGDVQVIGVSPSPTPLPSLATVQSEGTASSGPEHSNNKRQKIASPSSASKPKMKTLHTFWSKQ